MKAWITLKPECKKLFILLFPFVFMSGSCFKAHAQGWSFTPSIVQTDCGNSSYTSTANSLLATFSTSVKLPTQPQCEAIRQILNGFSTGGDWYSSGNPPVHHHCSLTITCTACSGSDMVTPGQVNPGDVSFNGQTDGKPLFTPHQSEAFEDWARDYKALLESYGITSILGNRLTPHPVPVTGDKDIDDLYDTLAAKFNPPAPPPRNPPNQNPNVVDLSGKKGVVKILNQPEEEKALKVADVPVPVPGEIKAGHEYIDFGRETLVSLVGLAPKQYSYLGIAIIDLYAEDTKALMDCLGGSNCPSTSTILTNAASQATTDMAMQGLGDIGGFANGQLFSSIADRSMIKKGVLPGIEGVVTGGRISEIGEAHFSIVNTAVDTGKKILNAWGITTAYDDEKK